MNKAGSIAFLTARLRGGGVADHVTRLGAALEQHGITTFTMSRGVDLVQEMQAQCSLHTIRWVGIHFVTYGWARHGILRQHDIDEIQSACSGRHIALYLHELWMGEDCGASLKNQALGYLQKRGLLRLINRLDPAKVLTSNPVYQIILARNEIAADVIPLFGNLPTASPQDRSEARAWLNENGIQQPATLIATFGTIHPEWNPIPALHDWFANRSPDAPPVTLLVLGYHGPAASYTLKQIRKNFPQLQIVTVGGQPAPLLAGMLSECTFGLATSPWALIGKSGTVAAMRETGLPVLVTRNDWQWRKGKHPPPTDDPQIVLWRHDIPFDWPRFLNSPKTIRNNLPHNVETWQQIAEST